MKRRTPLYLSLLLLAPLDAAWASCPADLPGAMNAARIHAKGGPEAIVVESIPVPKPGAGEVLIRVRYAAVNPVDWKLQQGGYLPYPAVPGGDLSGEVVAVGDGAATWQCGDDVVAIVDQRSKQGSYAEYVVASSAEVVAKPAKLDWDEAAGYATVGVAAWRFLVEGAKLERGERVLIHGGAGGVGSIAVQIAKARGAHVIATASARNEAYLRELGVDEFVDYQAVRFEDVVKPVDVVFDTVGGDTLVRSVSVLKPGGRLVSAAGRPPADACAETIACPSSGPWDVERGLGYLRPLVEAGQVRVNIERSFPLAEAGAAQAMNKAGHTRGKIVIAMPAAGDDAP